jgi:hypothetical protein
VISICNLAAKSVGESHTRRRQRCLSAYGCRALVGGVDEAILIYLSRHPVAKTDLLNQRWRRSSCFLFGASFFEVEPVRGTCDP